MASWHLENCIPIHQAHSRCFGESQSPGSGCAVICREKNNETPRKKKLQVFGLFFPARSEKQQAASTGRLRYGHDQQRGQ